MSTEKRVEQQDKYLKGQSSLSEEENLLKERQGSHLAPWAAYREKYRKSSPEGLQGRVWDKIEASSEDINRGSKRNIYYWLTGIAATLALIAVFFLGYNNSSEMTLEDKQAKLQEALKMFDDETNDSNVIYEDDIIVIYTEKVSTN